MCDSLLFEITVFKTYMLGNVKLISTKVSLKPEHAIK